MLVQSTYHTYIYIDLCFHYNCNIIGPDVRSEFPFTELILSPI